MLAELTEENVRKIELHVQKNRDILIGTEYERLADDFEFLPGHRAFVLTLPEKVGKIIQLGKNGTLAIAREEKTTATVKATTVNDAIDDEIQVLKSKLLVKFDN